MRAHSNQSPTCRNSLRESQSKDKTFGSDKFAQTITFIVCLELIFVAVAYGAAGDLDTTAGGYFAVPLKSVRKRYGPKEPVAVNRIPTKRVILAFTSRRTGCKYSKRGKSDEGPMRGV
jgi:hypothetical protein